MLEFLDVNNTLFTLLGSPVSLIELVATISGGIAVWLSAKENVWSWIIGLINVLLAFKMFWQIGLYPDMFLQVFFFITNVIGFWLWKFPKAVDANAKSELKITRLSTKNFLLLSGIGILGTVLLGTFAKNLNGIAPSLFTAPSAFPYMDSFTTVMSVVATFMLIKKKLEAWWIWLGVDIIAAYMYYVKDVRMYSMLYLIFVVIAAFGAIEWMKRHKIQEAE